jgi:predicted peroxiredoxin
MNQRQPCYLQIMITCGPEALGRAVLGFAFAVSAATSGVNVTIILILQGMVWAEKNIPAAGQSVNGFQSVRDYMDVLEDNGAVVRLCSSCVEGDYKLPDNEGNTAAAGPYIGLTEVALRTTNDNIQTVVF